MEDKGSLGDQAITALNANDVLFGRGLKAARFEGNSRFRKLIQQRRAEYVATRRHHAKERIAREVIQAIQAENGRFLMKLSPLEKRKAGIAEEKDAWRVVAHTMVLEKVKQTFRDARGPDEDIDDSEGESLRPDHAPQQINAQMLVPPTAAVSNGAAFPSQQMSMQNIHASLLQQQMQMPVSQFPPLLGNPALSVPPALLNQEQQQQQLLQGQPLQFVSMQQQPPPMLTAQQPTSPAVLREIPSVYQDLLSTFLTQAPATFGSSDLSLLVQAQSLAMSEGDIVRLSQIHTVLSTLLQTNRHRLTPVDADVARTVSLQLQNTVNASSQSNLLAAQQQQQQQQQQPTQQQVLNHPGLATLPPQFAQAQPQTNDALTAGQNIGASALAAQQLAAQQLLATASQQQQQQLQQRLSVQPAASPVAGQQDPPNPPPDDSKSAAKADL